ncbi:MAG: putative RNA methyltransferase [Microcella sp.]
MTIAPVDDLEILRCPHCGGALEAVAGGARCSAGHHHDRAKQGYLGLRVAARGLGAPAAGDTADMVDARERFQGAGHHDSVAAAVRDAAVAALAGSGVRDDGWVVDLAGGPGWHLGHVLDALPGMRGLVLDASTIAVRRAQRSHPRAVAATADLRARIPIADGAAALVLKVFAPGPAAEIERVLTPGGVLVAAIPEPEHHRELVQPLKLLKVPAGKAAELVASLPGLQELARTTVRETVRVDRAGALDAVFMGPNAFHQKREQVETALAALPEPLDVTVAVTVVTLRQPG